MSATPQESASQSVHETDKEQSFEKLSFESLAWACLLYNYMTKYDEPYKKLLKDGVISTLRTNPGGLGIEDVKDKIITGFLNKWSCRLKVTDPLAQEIIQATTNISQHLQRLNGMKLIDLDLDGNGDAIKNCYRTVVNIGGRFSHTAASKFLHVINPELFVIWDSPMREHYKKHYGIATSPDGYFEYMKKMKEGLNNKVLPSFRAAENQCPAIFLSEKLQICPPKTFVKYLDEYNWITITRGVIELPPPWHPERP